jgi:hypothetical protein
MAALKTRPTDASVDAFLDGVDQDDRREDARRLLAMMQRVTQEPPRMWGDRIVGFGSYHYRYASGREGDWPLIGLSPGKRNLTLYIMPGFDDYQSLLARLGNHRTGKSCLYLNRLQGIDMGALEDLMRQSVADMRRRYPEVGA